MNRALSRVTTSGVRRALRALSRVARIAQGCVSRCCGCTSFVFAESCEGIAYDPPPSELCPALPRIYVCANIVPPSVNGGNVVIKYNGTCYVIGTGVESVPDGAVTLTDPAQFENIGDCRDPRCNSNRFFYRARTCSGEPDTVPDVYVCVAGVPFDCAVFRYNATPGDPATYCYRLDRSTPIDEDDIPSGSVRVAFVSPTQTFQRCCDCLSDCESDLITTAPCGDPAPTTTCCCVRNAAKTYTYSKSSVVREGRAGFPGYFGVTTFETLDVPTLYCAPDGTTIRHTGRQRLTTVLWDGSVVSTEGDLDCNADCAACHPPTFAAPRVPCSGTALENNQFGFPQLVTWHYIIANRCNATTIEGYERVSDPNNAANFTETEWSESYTLNIEDNGQRCSGGCDGYSGVPLGRLAVPADLRNLEPVALFAELRRLSGV